MIKKSTSSTCCLTLPLKLEKWQEDRLAKRFEIARQIYNTLVHAELKKLRRLEQTPAYRENQARIRALYLENAQKSAEFCKCMDTRRKLLQDAGFSESNDYAFKTDMKDYYKHFKDNIGSSVADHGIAPQAGLHL